MFNITNNPDDSLFHTAPARTGDIKRKFIGEKLKELGVNISDISLGDFDFIGEFTAKKQRPRDSELYNSVGAFFRPNYERGILIHTLIKKFQLKSYLEIGFGRGYSCMCAAMAMAENGGGSVTTVDPNLDENHLKNLGGVLPQEWFSLTKFAKCTSDQFFQQVNENYDLIFIDGDHRYDAVRNDWKNTAEKYDRFLLFDDYHLPGKEQKDIEVSGLVDSIDDASKELIIMDRRIFFDDRRISDDQIDYGQVLLTK